MCEICNACGQLLGESGAVLFLLSFCFLKLGRFCAYSVGKRMDEDMRK